MYQLFKKKTSVLAAVQGGRDNRTQNQTNTKVMGHNNIYVEIINKI